MRVRLPLERLALSPTLSPFALRQKDSIPR
jgi:hypothetical protein